MASCFFPEVSPECQNWVEGKLAASKQLSSHQKRDVEKTRVRLNMEHARFEYMWWFIISQFSKSYITSPFRVVPFFWTIPPWKNNLFPQSHKPAILIRVFRGMDKTQTNGGVSWNENPKMDGLGIQKLQWNWMFWKTYLHFLLFRNQQGPSFFTCFSLGNHSMDRCHRWDRWDLRRDRRALPVFAVEDVAWRSHHPGDADGASELKRSFGKRSNLEVV